MPKTLLFILFIYTQSIYGLDSFCFSRRYSLKDIKSHVLTITSPKDKVYLRESNHCLEIETSTKKRELIEKWIKRKYPILNAYSEGQAPYSSNQIIENCKLAVEKSIKGESEVSSASIGKQNTFTQASVKTTGKSTSSLILGKGSSGSISVNGQRVELECLQSGSNAYKIRVSLSSHRQALSTQLVVSKGVRTDLGSIVEDLNKKSTVKGVPAGISQKSEKGSFSYDYFLLAK